MGAKTNNSDIYPHSPDVLERDTADDGFSKGWGMHFQPSEKYWVDCHVHVRRSPDFRDYVDKWFDWSHAWRQAKFIAIDAHPKPSDSKFSYKELGEIVSKDHRLAFLYYPGINTPDADLLEEALNSGAQGVKLWSPTFVLEGRPADEFEDPKWEVFFNTVNERRLVILWHVTQRITDSPYTGGGRNAYWSEGWKKGVKYTNEDLLQSFLRIAKAHPDGHFIGAHQLHLGWERLEELLEEYPNLYIDTSIGCFVRWGDVLYPDDRDKLRDFFIKYADRILFGTDINIGKGSHTETEHLSLMGHILFIRQLRLPYEELQKISHENAEKLFRLEKSSDVRTGNIRP
jgi:predicted TIM-barrel fold metal-dependent hydrolase